MGKKGERLENIIANFVFPSQFQETLSKGTELF